MQKVRSHRTSRLLLFVCMRFQVLFHSPPGVLFAFPSQYWFTIGRSRVFSLGGWSPRILTGYHVSRHTHLSPCIRFRLRDCHPLSYAFPDVSAFACRDFGLFPVRSPLLGESRLISFPRGTEMFHFSRFAFLSE